MDGNEDCDTDRKRLLCPHFGHCDEFTMLTWTEFQEVVSTQAVPAPEHEPGLLPRCCTKWGRGHHRRWHGRSRPKACSRKTGFKCAWALRWRLQRR